MVIIPYDEISDKIESKIEELKSVAPDDVACQIGLWKETFLFRRKTVRDQSTSEVMALFPAYSDSILVSLFLFILCLN